MNRFFIALFSIVLSVSVFANESGSMSFEDMLAAAKNGDAGAQRSIGLSYHFGKYILAGEEVKQDGKEAVKWLRLSSKNGNCFAAWFLGGLYHEGKGVEQNTDLAAKYFLLAAQRGHIKAQRNMAAFYYYGTSVEKDLDWAYAWASIANFNQPNNKNTQSLLNMIIPELDNREASNVFSAKQIIKYRVAQEDCGNS